MDIDFPYRIDETGRTATTGRDDHVRDMIEQLLLTSPGERVNRPDFGSGLLQMVFGSLSEELAAAVQFTTRGSLQRWLGDVIDLVDLDVDADDSTLQITVRYVVLRTGEARTDTFDVSTA